MPAVLKVGRQIENAYLIEEQLFRILVQCELK